MGYGTFRGGPAHRFVALLKAEGRSGVLGLDCGQGADGLHFVQSGIHFTGVDPSEENIHSARARGPGSLGGGGRPLPFADSRFPSVWAVDALAGLPPEEWDDVVRELGRVAAPGAPDRRRPPGPARAARAGFSRSCAPPPGTHVDRSAVVVLSAENDSDR